MTRLIFEYDFFFTYYYFTYIYIAYSYPPFSSLQTNMYLFIISSSLINLPTPPLFLLSITHLNYCDIMISLSHCL
ncbi:hypothetical protein BC941DRAFT_431244 [Chlamydoabsidia padenii]|nr:hypothetical protein BC941DRAFT_431244 [Chlamydoabsidia padenii]